MLLDIKQSKKQSNAEEGKIEIVNKKNKYTQRKQDDVNQSRNDTERTKLYRRKEYFEVKKKY